MGLRLGSAVAFSGLWPAQMLFEMFHLFSLCSLECSHSLEHLVPVNECSVEFRSVDAYELCLSSYCQSACAAHSRAVHHDCVERHVGGDIIFSGEQAAEFHHYRGADGHNLVNVFLVDEFLYSYGHHSLLAV